MVGFSARPDNRGGGGVSVSRGLASLVDVLGEPAEALAVALPLQHTAHEHLQWSCVQLLQGNVALRMEEKKKKQKEKLNQIHFGTTTHWYKAHLLHMIPYVFYIDKISDMLCKRTRQGFI